MGGSGGSAKWGGGLGSAPGPQAPSFPFHQLGKGCPCFLPHVKGVYPVPEHPSWPMGLGRREASWGLRPSALTHTHSSTTCSPLSLGLSCSSTAPRAQTAPHPPAEGPGSRSERTAWELWAGVWRLLGTYGWGQQVWGQVPEPRLLLGHTYLSVPEYLLPSCFPCCPWVLSNPRGTFVFLENKVCQVNAVRFNFRLGAVS